MNEDFASKAAIAFAVAEIVVEIEGEPTKGLVETGGTCMRRVTPDDGNINVE